MASKRLLRLGNGQVAILKRLLFDYVHATEKIAKTNRIVRNEFQIVRKLYHDLENKGRLCPTCGQRVKQ